jgi:hypothetical protein
MTSPFSEPLKVLVDTAPGRRPQYSSAVICPIAGTCSDTACPCRRPHRKVYTCNRCVHDLCPTCVPHTGKRKGVVKPKQDRNNKGGI